MNKGNDMSKHTAGPWTVEPHGATIALYSGRDRDHHGLRLMNLDDGDSNFEANARLIAAAPDLLAALQESYAVIAGLLADCPEGELAAIARKAQEANDAALTKAGCP